MMAKTSLRAMAWAAGLLLAALLTLGAGPKAARAADEGWKVELAPYMWMINVSGDVTIKGYPTSTSMNFHDIWDSLDFAGEVHLEVWKGRWALFFDPTYLKTTQGANLESVPVTVKSEVAMVEFGGIYRLIDNHLDQSSKRIVALELLAGGRYNSLKGTLELPTGHQPEARQEWVDPFAGGRVRWDFLPGLELILRSDIGGFGLGSKVAWNSSLLLQYKPTDWLGLVVGYRYLYMDYEDGSGHDEFKYDVTLQGPIVALHFSF